MAEFHAASMTVDPRNLLLHQGGLAGPQPKTSGPRARDTANLNLASSADDDNNDEVYYEWQHLSGAFSNLSNDQNEPRKRGFEEAFAHADNIEELPNWIGGPTLFPDFLPSVPSRNDRRLHTGLLNPFLEDQGVATKHPALKEKDATLVTFYKPKEATDAFIKVQWVKKTGKNRGKRLPRSQQWLAKAKAGYNEHAIPDAFVARLPPHFGDVGNLDHLDRGFHRFFLDAICAGRTVIESDNAYKTDIAPMIERSELVRHAVLALSTAYILDFNPSDNKIKAKAAHHHAMAVDKLGEELNNLSIQSPGQEEAVCAAIRIMCHSEVVCWEANKPSESSPKWYIAGQVAERIMSTSDPAYRYIAPLNVQCTRARISLSQIIGLENITSDCVHPFDFTLKRCSYPWLLEGTEREQRKIGGITGLCSKLLHYFAKITFLSSKLAKDPESTTYPLIADEIGKRLENFWQWSELSEGYATYNELLESCSLDEYGKVSSKGKITELIGESYVCAAQIYIQCRFYRRPRSDPLVQSILKRLLDVIDRQPTSGSLFTAQTPLFPVFFAGVVAHETTDRNIVQKYFDVVCSDSRGNVPPAWRALQQVWDWADNNQNITIHEQNLTLNADLDSTVGNRFAWWEDMVAMLKEKMGRMSLS